MKTSLVFFALLSTSLQAEECGNVTIADMNWNSASLMAHIDQFILNQGFNCDAELIPGDSIPTITSMLNKGQPDIAPEFWTNGSKKALAEGIAEKRLRKAGRSLSEGGEEGFWVPAYLLEQYPNINTLAGIKENADIFVHPEDPELSAFYSCPAGWVCQITTENLFNALNLAESGFETVDPGSAAGLSGSIAKAYSRKEPWFGYYWSPTEVLGKYEMVKVDFGTGTDVEGYQTCITQPGCLEPKATMYPPSPVYSITTESFAINSPAAYQYVSQRSFNNRQMSKMLAWMEDNQADSEEAMYYFFETYPDVWQAWLPESISQKINNAL
ncbi:ABC transporter substrate-binding protein [Marinomonas sp. PE14-40]|uniref:ABC transporter substrate-binding protein n=1 Tax=Marinomonas sp. PE14-40 TaxID=3060621 RepID=UPI003F665B25